MLRITTWRINNPRADLPPGAGPQAFNDMCAAREKLPGAGKVRWYFGNNGVVTIGAPENYAVADTILKTPAAQAAVGKVLSIGFGIVEDQFLLDPAQVMPFADQAQQAQTPALSRN